MVEVKADMIASANFTGTRIRDRLAGQHLLVTGSTGFLAKAFIEKLLRSVDTVGGIHLLVRPRAGGASPAQRVKRDVLNSNAFDRLRAALGERFEQLCEKKIHIVGGDLTLERFGLDPEAYGALTRQITMVVNSAATVTFDERLDLAVELNTLGPQRLLQFAKDCGDVPFLHVSTCYVCGARSGVIVEDFSAPESAREKLPRIAASGQFDLDGLVETLRAEAAKLRLQYGADTDACRQKLIDAGMEQSRHFGWNDTYTFTKWIGEQMLVRDRGKVQLSVFRPAIIESSYDEPAPGWIDGLRMADPIIVAFGRGKMTEFPAREHIALDVIPCDFVANAMIATLPIGGWRAEPVAVYQCGSSERNPINLRHLCDLMRRAFLKRPMNGDDGRPIHPETLRGVDAGPFCRKWSARRRHLETLRKLCERFAFLRRRGRKLAATIRQIDQMLYFSKIYSPYTHLDCRFVDEHLRAVAEKLDPADRAEFPFDASRIDWEDYMVNRHIPGLRAYVLGTGFEPSARIRSSAMGIATKRSLVEESLQADSIFAVFQCVASHVPDKHFVQIKRQSRWVRYTYDEALRATGTIMRRFTERGLRPGDKVAILGDSGPEWGLTYLAVMRAGMTAVPLDPQLLAREAWQCSRFAEAKLFCCGEGQYEALKTARQDDDPPLVQMAEAFVPPPAASRDPAPEPVAVASTSLASILFTSGTTVAPKAVQLSHRNFLANAHALVQVHPLRSDDEFLSVLPMYHAFEFTGGFMLPMAGGATITYIEQLKGPEIRAAMQATGTTVMLVVPRLLRMFHDAIMAQLASAGAFKRGAFKLLSGLSRLTGGKYARTLFGSIHRAFGGRLRMFVSGGSRLDPDLFDAFARLGFEVYEGYGLTETAPVLSVNPPGAARGGAVGPMLPNVDVEVRSQNLEGIGEVWVRGPSIMSGYLHNEDATREVLEDGWLRTGDLGRLDADGYLHLTGRSKDLIVTGAGKNVYPDEVEMRYRELPYVKELCVFGMPSADGMGDLVHAVMVLDSDANPELDRSSMEREVRLAAETISESLPSHQRIAVLHFWDRELPKTSTLKAKRNLIRETVSLDDSRAAGFGVAPVAAVTVPEATTAVPENPAAQAAVFKLLARHSKLTPDAMKPGMHLLLDLGIDSIGKLEVIGGVEACFDMRIDDDRAAGVVRVSDLLRIVGPRQPKKDVQAVPAMWHHRLSVDAQPVETNGHITPSLLPIRWMVRGSIGAFMNSYVRVRAIGVENIPLTGSFILAPNHSSHLDTPSVLTAIGSRRRVWAAGAEDYFFNTALKRFLFGKVLDTIAFDRQADGLRGLKRCADALTRGDGLLMFPEGTRTITGEMQPFKIGVALLAAERQAPIVPVYVGRTFELFRKGQRWIRPGVATVVFGAPIQPPRIGPGDDAYAIFRQLTERLETAVHSLRDQAGV